MNNYRNPVLIALDLQICFWPTAILAALVRCAASTVAATMLPSVGECGGAINGANSTSLTNTAPTSNVKGITIWTSPTSGTATARRLCVGRYRLPRGHGPPPARRSVAVGVRLTVAVGVLLFIAVCLSSVDRNCWSSAVRCRWMVFLWVGSAFAVSAARSSLMSALILARVSRFSFSPFFFSAASLLWSSVMASRSADSYLAFSFAHAFSCLAFNVVPDGSRKAVAIALSSVFLLLAARWLLDKVGFFRPTRFPRRARWPKSRSTWFVAYTSFVFLILSCLPFVDGPCLSAQRPPHIVDAAKAAIPFGDSFFYTKARRRKPESWRP